jgi:hypothetical protein
MRTTRPAPAEAMKKLTMLMFQGYKIVGDEGLKGEQADSAQMARGVSMIKQAMAAARGMAGPPPQQQNLPQGSDVGRRQPIDRPVDPMTRRTPGSSAY